MATQQRLIVCLDGTWNQQDNSTNVLHHFNLMLEGAVPGTNIIQRKYYHPGVGTGVLDRITGGGFGFGLEKNVRDAYNWLVEHYCDGEGEVPSDEIYIFGFSRGAYTARSLVGFIGQCGLLRRAAPITVQQLWGAYCLLGRRHEQRRSVWDNLFSKPKPSVRPITDLARDPWLPPKSGVPAISFDEMSASEKLLVRWSRRVKITYLGVYDTVGAIGWDALAIPGLTSRLAMHNNMRPTTIIQNCRHALAMDEHRSSFNHTPFLAFVGHDAGEQEEERGTEDSSTPISESAETAKQHWDRTLAMWNRKIEQRWFAGAHSNIGGGYEDNRLAQIPLQWILEGAWQEGLVGDRVHSDPRVTYAEQPPRDSFAEFASPVWTKILRAKPNYRLVDPDALPQASIRTSAAADSPAGFSLQTIHEDLDASVETYWERLPMPPNLFEYKVRRGHKVAGQSPEHTWLPPKVWDHVALVLWATLAGSGLAPLYRLTELNPSEASRLVGACLAAFILPLLDWGESAVNFRIAMGKGSARACAFRDTIYWTRAFGFVLFLCGVVYSTVYLWELGWRRNWPDILLFGRVYLAVPVVAAAAILLVKKFQSKPAWISLFVGPAALVGAGGLLIVIAWFARHLFHNVEMGPGPGSSSLPIAGWLLLLQFGFVYFWRALIWTRDPLSKANLGSITLLQRCFTRAQVEARLERWRSMLVCRWRDEDPVTGPAATRMRQAVREALWRDILGLIPVYTGVSVLGLWFAVTYLRPGIFGRLADGPIALWLLIPLVAAAANYLEDATHLRYLNLHERGQQPSSLLTMFSGVMLVIKVIALLVALVVSSVAVGDGTLQVWSPAADWRAKIAILISLAFALTILLYVAGRVIHVFASPAKTPAPGVPELAKSASTGGNGA